MVVDKPINLICLEVLFVIDKELAPSELYTETIDGEDVALMKNIPIKGISNNKINIDIIW